MQNKQHKKLEDKGWKMMQQVLDQELPTNEKEEDNRRGFLWFWMSGAALFILAFSWWNWSAETITPQQPIVETIEEKATSKEVPASIQKEAKIESFISETKSQTKIVNQPISKNSSTENRSVTTKSKTSNHTFSSIKPIDSQSVASVVDHSTKVVNDYKQSDKSPIKLAQSSSEITEVIPFLSTQLSFLEIQNESLNLALPQPNLSKAKKIKRRKNLKGNWQANAAMTSTLGGDINGLKTGVNYELPLSSRWALSTGLNYRLSRQNTVRLAWGNQHNGRGNADAENIITNPVLQDSLPNGEATINEYYFDANNKALQSTYRESHHFVSMPINAKYQFAKKWNLTFGVEGSYTFKYPNGLQVISDDAFDLSSHQGNDPISGSSFNLLRWDVAATLGTSYQINKSWSANLAYHHGNLLQMNNWQPNNQYLQLGMGYRF